MPKIINEYGASNPLAEALQSFAGSFGGNTAQQELYRQKAQGSLRENRAYQALQDAERNGGYDPNNADVRAAIVGLPQPKEFFEAQRGIAATRYGAGDQRATNAYMGAGGSYGSTVAGTRESEANRRAIEDKRTERMFGIEKYKFDNTFEQTVGPDGRVILTPRTQAAGMVSGKQAELDQQRAIEADRIKRGYDAELFKVNNTPELVQGPNGPTIMRRSEAFGMTPVLNEGQAKGTIVQQDMPTMTGEQRATVGGYQPKPDDLVNAQLADGTTVPAYNRADGLYHAQTGQKITQPIVSVGKLQAQNAEGLGGSALTNKLVERRVATGQALNAIDRLDKALAAPNADQAVGWIGKTAGLFNDVRAQNEALSRMIANAPTKDQELQTNPTLNKTLDMIVGNSALNQTAQRLGIQSAVLRSQIADLAYSISKANDPGGRMSDQDIHRAAQIIGASLQDPVAARAVLQDLKVRLNENHNVWERETARVRSQQPQSAPAAAPAAAPTAAPPRIRIDANGNVIQ
jgi:hypothetical protein